MIKLGIDVHGVADSDPSFFSELTRTLVASGHEVHILTGSEHTPELETYLKEELRLTWTHLFSITSHNKARGVQVNYIDGKPFMDEEIWNRTKAQYCERENIHLHIDDSGVYGHFFSTPYAKYTKNQKENQRRMQREDKPVDKSKQTEPSSGSNRLNDDLSGYDDSIYKKPSVTVDVAICTIMDDRLKVLLIKRKFPPFRNSWAIPGGFLEIDRNESLEETAARELEEETGLKNMYIEQLKTYGDVGRDPRTRVITTAYFALISREKLMDQHIQSADDASDAKWFSLYDLEHEPEILKTGLAFDHNHILKDLGTRLRGKISYTPIAFELVPERFTWTQLRRVYEIVLDKDLDPTNFKKKIKSVYKIRELKKTQSEKTVGRPAGLLSFAGVRESYI